LHAAGTCLFDLCAQDGSLALDESPDRSLLPLASQLRLCQQQRLLHHLRLCLLHHAVHHLANQAVLSLHLSTDILTRYSQSRHLRLKITSQRCRCRRRLMNRSIKLGAQPLHLGSM
jgi:EAL domain-containing protein (putative c-di-GMP-specific phosphodiesterase class I)